MLDEPPDESDRQDGRGSVDRRQLLLVALCLCGLVVAAFLAPPPVSPSVTADDGDQRTPAGRDGGGGGGGAGGEGGDESVVTPRRGSDGGGSEGESGNVVGERGDPIPIPGGDAPPTEDGCAVLVTNRPVPGSTVTVRVFDDRRPVSGTQVWFDGEPVGPTNDHGNATGHVPYNRTLSVTVEAGGSDGCEFYRTSYRTTYRESTGSIAPLGGSILPIGGNIAPLGTGVVPNPGFGAPSDASADFGQEMGENSTGEYDVYGQVNLTVQGEPYPGSAVTVRATIAGVPVRSATVTNGGSEAGETDDRGRYRLTVPDRDQAAIAVSRGDFAGDVTLDVLLLEASVRPQEGLPFPGEPARTNVTLDDSPKAGVGVSLGGRRLGSTANDGAVAFDLPVDPTASLTARTSRQTVRVPVWRIYAPTIANSIFILGLGLATTVGASRFGSPIRARRAVQGWSAVGVAFVGLVVGERVGLLVALGAIATVVLYRKRDAVRSGGTVTGGVLAWLIRESRRLVMAVTVVLEKLIDRLHAGLAHLWTALGRLATRLGTLLRSPRALLAAVLGTLERLWTAIGLYLTVYRVGFLLLAFAEVVAATARWEVEGFVASVASLACLAAFWAAWRRRGGKPGPSDTNSTTSPSRATGESVDAGSTVVSLRGLYRRFASWVVPGEWRTRTPGEVSRAAVDRGFPSGPVEALTGAFRDVEYGDEPTETRRERAREAYERLARFRRRDEGDDS